MLKVVARYHCIQSQGKSMTQAQENDKKPDFRHDLGPLDQNSGHQFFFQKSGLVSHEISWSKIIM